MRDGDAYASYAAWCRENEQPNKLIPDGVLGSGTGARKLRYHEGLVYRGRRRTPVDFYLPACRYGGVEMVVRWEERYNARRFEALRWKLLCYLHDRVRPAAIAHHQEMFEQQPIRGRDRCGHLVHVTVEQRPSIYTDEEVLQVQEDLSSGKTLIC